MTAIEFIKHQINRKVSGEAWDAETVRALMNAADQVESHMKQMEEALQEKNTPAENNSAPKSKKEMVKA
jgi:hypothetical protein